MSGIVIQRVREDALVAAIIDRGKHAEGAIIQCIGSDIARKIRQGPVKKVGVHARLGLFSPQPPPNPGWSQKAQRRGGRAGGAKSPAGRASRPRPPVVPPGQSRGACPDCRVAPDPTGQHGSTSDMSYKNAATT